MNQILEFLTMLLSAFLVLLFFGFSVFIHELGHFLVAKWRGLHIVAFSIGFRKVWSKKINGVDYRIGWIPAGGYVDLPQVDTTEPAKDEDGNDLPPAKPWDRLLTAVAGPLFNIISGMLLACIIWWHGIPQETPDYQKIVVSEIIVDSPEYRAGLRPNDVIVELNGKEFDLSWKQFTQRILFQVGEVNLTIERDGERKQIVYTPIANPYVAAEVRREGLGLPFFTPKVPLIVTPLPNSPAEKAGLKAGDIILRANENEVDSVFELQFILAKTAGQNLYLEVAHADGSTEQIVVTPKENLDNVNTSSQHGMFIYSVKDELKIASVTAYSPADQAGIQIDDTVLSINGNKVTSDSNIAALVKPEEAVTLTLKRGDDIFDVTIEPAEIGVYAIGVTGEIMSHPTPWKQFVGVVDMSYYSLRGIGFNLANKLHLTEKTTTVSAKNLSGPLGIVKVMYSAFDSSFILGIYVAVFISFALAITNLLPLPVLDGGHILFALIEIIFRRPLPSSLIKKLSMIFVVLLIGGMIAVTILDVIRFIPAEELKEVPKTVSVTSPESESFDVVEADAVVDIEMEPVVNENN